MLSGVTPRAAEIAGTAVFRIVVSSDSMKNATATSHGNSRLLASVGCGEAASANSVDFVKTAPVSFLIPEKVILQRRYCNFGSHIAGTLLASLSNSQRSKAIGTL